MTGRLTVGAEMGSFEVAAAEEVIADEADYLRRRKRNVGLGDDALRATVGLALSGGGIRSATFALGVLQALHELRLWRRVDYLSTVSGGGFIGATLGASLAAGPDATSPDFPLAATQGRPESGVVSWLRRHSEYLRPRGWVEGAGVVAVVLRGIVLNAALLGPIVVAAAAITVAASEWSGGRPLLTVASTTVLGATATALIPLSALGKRLRLGWRWKRAAVRAGALAISASFLVTVAILQPALIAVVSRYVRHPWGVVACLVLGLALASFGWLFSPSARRANVAGWIIRLGAPLLVWALYVAAAVEVRAWAASSGAALALGGCAIACLLATSASIGPNTTSLHEYYRDRISRAFVVNRGARNDAVHRDPVRLSQLCRGADTTAPYPIINCALNLHHDNEGGTRTTEAFVASPRWVGSETTGYCPTESLERRDPGFDLATATAVSGAAICPSMPGASSLWLGLLNARLGYWAPHPAGTTRTQTRWRLGVGVACFFRELLRRFDAHGSHVYLSDGGHVDNTGAYELIRRRCRFLLISDAEADPHREFDGVARLMRRIRIDFGYELTLDLAPLAADAAEPRCWTTGFVDYGDGSGADVLYVKPTLTSGEPLSIANYSRRNPDFPHQSTGDQFFDDDQFEAYRHLGHRSLRGLPALAGDEVEDIEQWFADIKRAGGHATRI